MLFALLASRLAAAVPAPLVSMPLVGNRAHISRLLTEAGHTEMRYAGATGRSASFLAAPGQRYTYALEGLPVLITQASGARWLNAQGSTGYRFVESVRGSVVFEHNETAPGAWAYALRSRWSMEGPLGSPDRLDVEISAMTAAGWRYVGEMGGFYVFERPAGCSLSPPAAS